MTTLTGYKWVALLLVLLFSSVAAASDQPTLQGAIEKLKEKSFRVKTEAVHDLAAVGGDRAKAILESLLESRVYKTKADGRIVLIDRQGDALESSDAETGEEFGTTEKSSLRRVVINNGMRRVLRKTLARLSLASASPNERQAAVKSLLGSLNPETVELLKDRLPLESDERVRDILYVALALADLESTEVDLQLSAIERLSSSMHREVRNQLNVIIAEDSEADEAVREAAGEAIANIDGIRAVYAFGETAFFGLSLGSVYALAAIGLAITFGVMGVLNMAHGELIMLGAYATWIVQQLMPNHIEASLIVAIPVAFLLSGLVGIAIERGIVRHLYGRPLETLLATFGVSLFLQQTVRSIFSPLNRAVAAPEWMSGQLVVNDALAFTYNRLWIIAFSFVVFGMLILILKGTTLGLQIRAVSQNRDMARAMGVRGGWIDAITFGLGAGVAGLAGVALSQLTNVGPNLGQSYIVDSFMVVVFGGVGNLWGTLVAGLTLGTVNKFLEPLAGAVLAKIFVLVMIVLFIQRRPRGLFPQHGRAADA